MVYTSMMLMIFLGDAPVEKPQVYTDFAAAQKKAEETQKPILLYVFDGY